MQCSERREIPLTARSRSCTALAGAARPSGGTRRQAQRPSAAAQRGSGAPATRFHCPTTQIGRLGSGKASSSSVTVRRGPVGGPPASIGEPDLEPVAGRPLEDRRRRPDGPSQLAREAGLGGALDLFCRPAGRLRPSLAREGAGQRVPATDRGR